MKSNQLSRCASLLLFVVIFPSMQSPAQENDSLAIHWVGHGTLFFEFAGKIIHIDPYSSLTDYNSLPEADLVCITHEHSDHFDINALDAIRNESTLLICPQAVKDKGTYTDTSLVMQNGDSAVIKDIPVRAVPAYNIPPGQIFHAEGAGNGYVFTFNELRVYVAGDTEDIEEMGKLGEIHIAFLPMNLPYTMTPEQAAHAAEMIRPEILYIYHFGNSDTAYFRTLVSGTIPDVRIGEPLRYEKTTDLSFPSATRLSPRSTKIKIYPNPAGSTINLRNHVPGTELLIYDTCGRLVMNEILKAERESQLYVGSLLSGYYLVRIVTRNTHQNFTLIKM